MIKNSSPDISDHIIDIDTAPLRTLRERLFAASKTIDIESEPDSVSKLTVLMINLTKTIRETESYNSGLAAKNTNDTPDGTLEERLKGYVPMPREMEKLRAELKERLSVIGPRLFDDHGP